PTNYIMARFPIGDWTSPDLIAGMVAMRILRDREFVEVRTKRNLSYAPFAGLGLDNSLPHGTLYVTAVDPNATMKVMLDELHKLGREPPPDQDLTSAKSMLLTEHYEENEGTDGQAGELVQWQLQAGDWRLAAKLPERVRAVTGAEVQSFIATHAVKLQTIV